MTDLTPGIQMRDRLLFDEWEPHIEPDYPGAEDEARFHFFRIYDQAYDLLVESGQSHEEAVSTVQVIFGSTLPDPHGGPPG